MEMFRLSARFSMIGDMQESLSRLQEPTWSQVCILLQYVLFSGSWNEVHSKL